MSLNNNNLLLFQLPGSHCKIPYIFWLLPYPFKAVPQSYLRDCLLCLIPQKVCQIKHSQLLGCTVFSVNKEVLAFQQCILAHL